MGVLRADDVQQLTEIFGELEKPVTIQLWSDDLELRLFIDEVAATGQGKLTVEKVDEPQARALGIERTPGMRLVGERASGKLLFYGHPVGYEMATFLAAIMDLGGPDQPSLAAETTQLLDGLARDVHIQVFSTPG